ncbi:MAG: hypothetical protein HQ481_12285 [Alphaproteobacteria bacterium]|nr:hypothetical protein [Alphaproteobacteria bacterium]
MNTPKTPVLSPVELARLGVDRIAYIKPVLVDSEQKFAVHTADGTAVTVFPSYDLAQLAIRQNDLVALRVH